MRTIGKIGLAGEVMCEITVKTTGRRSGER